MFADNAMIERGSAMSRIQKLILLILFVALQIPGFSSATFAAQQRPDMSKKIGDRAPIFSVATSQDYLANYDRDYYGKHHLLLTFFPAAFTPV